MLPQVTIQKNVFSTVGAPPSQVGILAIIASSSTGTLNLPGGYARTDLAVSAYGYGPLTDYAAYVISVANNPVVLQKANATYPGTYGAITTSMTGSSAITAGSSTPYDHYNIGVNIVNGGTIGVAGITYTYTTDGYNLTSGVQALGTANTLTIPNTGVTFNLGAGTLYANDSWVCYTERPFPNDSDVLTSLTALSLSRAPWEIALVDSSMTTRTVGLIDTFLAGLEAKGIFKAVLLNTRFKLEPLPNTESEAAYLAAMTTLVQNQTSIRICVGADGGHVPSLITAWNLKRPTSLLVAARAMSTTMGVDPAYVALGPLNGVQIANSLGNPFDHDEDLYPNLDNIRLMSLRSFAPGGPQGVYVTNANTIQPTGGAWPYLQFIRIGNQAATIAWFILATQLSRGVRKNPKADPTTGAVYIFEPDASTIESLVNNAYIQPFKGQVNAIQFSLSRTDNLAVVPASLTGLISIVALAYIKGFSIQLQYNKTIQVAN
jgi:hypothetical protein